MASVPLPGSSKVEAPQAPAVSQGRSDALCGPAAAGGGAVGTTSLCPYIGGGGEAAKLVGMDGGGGGGGGRGGGCAQIRAPGRAPEGVERAEPTRAPGLRESHVWAALCAVSSRRRGVGRGLLPGSRGGADCAEPAPPPHYLPVSAGLAALSPLRRCWPGWGSPASGALWTCWGWRMRL